MDSTGSVAVSSDQLTQSCLDGMAWLGMLRSSAPAPVLVEREFRSADLEVVAKLAFPDSCHTEYDTPIETAFKQFLHLRSQLAAGRSNPPTAETVIHELRRPRAVLITDWRSSLFDGAATPETDGFLDDNYMPGWDAWLALAAVEGAYGERCLLSWVPAWMGDRMDSGISVDPAECMAWAEFLTDGTIASRGWGKRWSDPSRPVVSKRK